MAESLESKLYSILSQVNNSQDLDKNLKMILSAANSVENCSAFIKLNVISVLRAIPKEINNSSSILSEIKYNLCKYTNRPNHIAFELSILREALDFVFFNIQSQVNNHGIYLPLSDLSSQFANNSKIVYEHLSYHLLMIYELGRKSEDVVGELSKYNIIPKLLFTIEKGPIDIKAREFTVKKSAQLLLNLILSYVEIATLVCNKLELFRWVLRIAKPDLYKSRELEMIKTLTLLSFSDEFLPKIDDDLIVSEWVYETLCMILNPERRSKEFISVNQNVDEQEFMILISFLSQILGNVSKSQGGMEEIISAMEHYGIDVAWRIQYLLLNYNINDFSVWYTTLYLTNNLLRYPYYSPPNYASE